MVYTAMQFGIPKIFITRYCETDNGVMATPILMICTKAEHCDFLFNQIVLLSTNYVYLNIDQSIPEKSIISVYLDSISEEGFIFTPDDMETIRQIAEAKTVPYFDYSNPLQRIIIGADFEVEPELADILLQNRNQVGYFELTFGFVNGTNGDFLSYDPPSVLKFRDYSTGPFTTFAKVLA